MVATINDIVDFEVGNVRVTVQLLGYYQDRMWFWRFKKYRYVWGYQVRLLGVDVNIRDKDTREKLIQIAKDKIEERKRRRSGK